MEDNASFANEYRVFGPPGCGKTTWTARNVSHAAARRGSSEVMVASFTKAAARELVGRRLPIPQHQVGTLHALCYRAMGNPTIAEGEVDSWNSFAPQFRLSSMSRASNDPADEPMNNNGGMTAGDELLQEMERLRARMVSTEAWPASVQAFSQRWERWKEQNDYVDFSDLIERCVTYTEAAPGGPSIGFFDEVQDFTPLELALVRKWGQKMDQVVLVGDDDQCIYRFKGSTPDAFLDPPLPDEQKRVLRQSYRVPHKVHRFAQAWVTELSRREPKEFQPREDEGETDIIHEASWRNPTRVIDDAEREIDAGRTVMFLATCSFMLDPLKAELRKRGLPFHNPYRSRRGDWNPLARRGSGISAADRVMAFMRPDEEVWGDDARIWNAVDLDRWIQVISAKDRLRHGAKKRVSRMASAEDVVRGELPPLSLTQLQEVFTEDAIVPATDLDLEWLRRGLLTSRRGPMGYAIDVFKKRGADALLGEPQATIGTIHSVKGGESDTVYLFPDVSGGGMREWLSKGEPRDSVVRQFYVGITRARHRLALVAPQSQFHIDLRRWMP